MILAKLKYKRMDNRIVVTKTLPLVKTALEKVLKRNDTDDGALVVFSKDSDTYTLMSHYPRPSMLYIGTQIGTLFRESTDLSCNVLDSTFEDYLEIHCPVVIRRTYNKRTKVHTIIFTDKQRN